MALHDVIEPPASAERRTPPRCFGRTMKTIDLDCHDGGTANGATALAGRA
jgi:hypothetical protein